jgi:hypothetical protein
MVYVDEAFVAAHLSKHLNGFLLKAVEPEDESVDGDVEIWSGQPGTKSPFSVQVGAGYLCLMETGYTNPDDSSTIWVRHHGMYGVRDDDLEKLVQDLRTKLDS